MRVAVVGGTGSFGTGARQAPRGGGLRRRDRLARRRAGDGSGRRARRRGRDERGRLRAADLVVLATKADAALETARELRDGDRDERRCSRSPPSLSFTEAGVCRRRRRRRSRRGSRRCVDGPVVAGLHSLAARNLGGEEAPDEDVLVCGDDAEAKALVMELAERITSGRAIDCGPLASARALEGLTAVIVNINKRYKAHAGVRVLGVR